MFGSGKKSSGRATAGRGGSGGLSFLGTDVVVSGNVTGTGQLHIDGRVDGDVKCETLIQGEGGTIAGHIDCDAVHLAGLVDGTVKARVVTLEPSARVTGDLSYETLSIAAGAAIEGRLTRKEASGAPATASVTAAPVADETPKPQAKLAKAGKAPKADEPGLLAMSAPAGGAPN